MSVDFKDPIECGTGKYTCPDCSKPFKSRTTYATHFNKTHRGLGKLCPACGFVATDSYKLKLHACPKVDFNCDVVQKVFARVQKAGLNPVRDSLLAENVLCHVRCDTHLILCTRSDQWPQGLGQLLKQSVFAPDLTPLLHLYGEQLEEEQLKCVAQACQKCSILCSAEWLIQAEKLAENCPADTEKLKKK